MIQLSQQQGLAQISIHRAEKANSLTAAMLTRICEALDEVAGSDCRALILTAEGKVFSAGADLDEARVGLATSPLWEQVSGRIAALPCLTIAALNGTLAGGAFGMALACELRIAVPQPRFFYPVMKLGFMPQPSDPARLRVLTGPARAKMILMAGCKASADQALDWGLIDQIVEPDALIATAGTLAQDCLSAAPDHVAAIKRLIDQP